jgi:capsular polysaccharide export protein
MLKNLQTWMINVTRPLWEELPPVIFGVCWWNHKSAKALLGNTPAKPLLCKNFTDALAEAKRKKGCLIGWASRISHSDEAACKKANIPLVRIEDGFLRSVGLGAGLAPAASLILDARGIYYDATRPSDLEWMLENLELGDEQRARGAALRNQILQARISKYNIGKALAIDIFPTQRQKVLVPGQVSDDAAILTTRSDSINLEGVENINLELLKAARQNNPDAFIIYKPHPDVASGLRKGGIKTSQMLAHADRVISDVDIVELIEKCDKVETVSSLAGFEALLRGKEVVVHGLPFYAGWGLTNDHSNTQRRTRRRFLDELVYIVLIAYSHYIHPLTYSTCEPEELIDALEELRQSRVLKIINSLRLRIAWIGNKFNSAT